MEATGEFNPHVADTTEESKRFHAFVNLALFMAAVTGIELVIIFVPFPYWFVYSAVVILSVVKFIGVVTWFMHLIYDKALLTILFMIGLVLATGTVTALLFLFSENDAIPMEEISGMGMILPNLL